MRGNERAYGDGGPIVGAAGLRERLGSWTVRVVDVRPTPAYAAGHLPGAYHADLDHPHLTLHGSSTAERRRFHPAVEAELLRIGARTQGAPLERVVTSCAGGFPRAANYAPSWDEWPGLPVEAPDRRGMRREEIDDPDRLSRTRHSAPGTRRPMA